jgi:hypothetical protein
MAAGCAMMLVAILTLTTSGTDGWSVYLFLLLCPAMYFLMNRRMNQSQNQDDMSKVQLPAPETKLSGNDRTKLSG